MRIVVPLSENNGEKSVISDHFGHAQFFAVHDTSTDETKIVENKSEHMGGKETALDQIIKHRPNILYVVGIGSRAVTILTAKKIRVKTGPFRILKDVISEEIVSNIDKLEDIEVGYRGRHSR